MIHKPSLELRIARCIKEILRRKNDLKKAHTELKDAKDLMETLYAELKGEARYTAAARAVRTWLNEHVEPAKNKT